MICLVMASLSYAQTPPQSPEPTPEPAPEHPVPEPAPAPPEAPEVEPATIVPVPVAEPPLALPEVPQPEPPEETIEQPPPPPYEPMRDKPLPFGVNLEYGFIANRDPSFQRLSRGAGMRSFGLSGGVRLAKYLVAVGGWHHVRQGTDLWIYSADTDADFQNSSLVLRSSIVANEVTLGARLDAPIEDIFVPFASAQGLLATSLVRLDDDPETRDNASQVKEMAVHAGGLFTGGAELRLPMDTPAQLALTMEFGYAWLGRSTYGDLGSMKPGGFAFRLGGGVRF